MFNGTVKDTFGKAEALQKQVKTVTMRAESLATTEAAFFKTLHDRQEAPLSVAHIDKKRRGSSTRKSSARPPWLNDVLLGHVVSTVFLSTLSSSGYDQKWDHQDAVDVC